MKVYLDMVGCRLNQSELEEMARQFASAGHTLTADPSQADLGVVNTCTVTVSAAADSRKTIRRLARSGVDEIVVTGCWATLAPEKAASLPGVTRVISNGDKNFLVSQLLSMPPEELEDDEIGRQRIPGSRNRTRAFIKTQDGCSHQCAFCITTIARGPASSIPTRGVLRRINQAVESGVKEAVLTGVQLGSWGRDLPGKPELSDLVAEILKGTSLPRLRLSSIEPWDITPGLVSTMASERVARHLHLPLQSGSVSTLARMSRAITPTRYARIVKMIRREIPEAAVTTDIMTGFPGETEEEFADSLAFVREMRFADGHVFTYSARDGTRAAALDQQIPHPVRKQRNARMRKVLAQSAKAYRNQFLGQQLLVLWEDVRSDHEAETAGDPLVRGLTDNYLRVETHAPAEVWNTITPARMVRLSSTGLIGEITSSQI
jgi:threonylcarbamoyladenosine tRNA methylthiotransferase MtaB